MERASKIFKHNRPQASKRVVHELLGMMVHGFGQFQYIAKIILQAGGPLGIRRVVGS